LRGRKEIDFSYKVENNIPFFIPRNEVIILNTQIIAIANQKGGVARPQPVPI
jgi:hypothetical protein